MKVEKRELKKRQFTPYEVIITIDSEEEHNKLQSEVREVESLSRSIRTRLDRFRILDKLMNEISNHKK